MKKKLLLAIPSLLLGTLGMSQISNGDLEMWQDIELYQDFSDWGSAREFEGDTILTQRSTDAFDGTYAASLTTDTIDGDTTFGFVIHGQFGDMGPESGIPFTGPGLPDSIIFWAKYNVMPGDSAVVLVVPFFGGSAVGGNEIKYAGTSAVWERKAYELGPTLSVDEILVAFASSNALIDYGIPGSTVLIDRVEIKTTTGDIFLVPNHSFENWDTVTTEDPIDWYGNAFYGPDTAVYKTTDAYGNVYAARLVTREDEFGDTNRAYLSNGFTDGSMWFEPVPYTQMPTDLEFYTKHIPNGADTAEISIEFFEAGMNVGGAYYRIDTAISTYTLISIPINYSMGAAPDSMRVIFTSGRNPGSELIVDLIELVDPTTSIATINNKGVIVYPNPAVNQITFAAPNNSIIKIYGTDGKLVQQAIANNNYTMNISDLNQGVYIYQVSSGNQIFKGKFIKK